MKVIAVSVGRPREVRWNGKIVRTSIFKAPVLGRVPVRQLNLDGDEQSDLTVHGGPEKAVYVYPSEHYSFWKEQLPGVDLPWGSFGENLTTSGLFEDEVRIGDQLHIGSAKFLVTQPRMPCFKLGIRFGNPTMIKRFLKARRPGFYLKVIKEGELGAGDSIELLANSNDKITVVAISDMYQAAEPDRELLRRASELPSLPSGWRDYFRKLLSR